VKTCLDSAHVLTVERRRLFSKRAREYMLAYSILDNTNTADSVEGDSKKQVTKKEKKPHMMAYRIEKIVKQYKSHRSAVDFDAGFINQIVDKM
jgi:hypothetical protein